jgi:membrane protein DedA with SNARE-associated domain
MTIRVLASLAGAINAVTVNTVTVKMGLASTAMAGSGPEPVLPGFLNTLSSPLQHYGLWAILVLVLVEDFGIPLPGETVLIAGAIFAGSGHLNVVAVGLTGFAAAVVGDNIGYAIGRFGGRALADRWGKYVFLTPKRLDSAEAFFERHGSKIIVIARFVEGLRQANGIIAGIAEMHWLRFLIFNAIGAALWVGTWVCVGYFAGQHISTIYTDITNYSLYAAIVAVVIIAAGITVRVRKRRREKADELAAEANEAPGPGETPTPAPSETTEAPEASQPASTFQPTLMAAPTETPAPPRAAADSATSAPGENSGTSEPGSSGAGEPGSSGAAEASDQALYAAFPTS